MKYPGSGKFALLFSLFLFFALQCFGDSHVRIVRLSGVEGPVQVDRNAGQGFETALLNLPMTQGVKLRTQHDARAEVEFEDGATLRLGSDTTIRFDQLSLSDNGIKNSVVAVESGVVYVNYPAKADSSFTLNFAHQTVNLNERVHLRLQMDREEAALAVFSGEAHIQTISGAAPGSEDILVKKNQTADFNLQSAEKYQLVKDVEPDVFDDWDKSQEKYHDRYMASASYQNNSSYSYGWSDLNYYGTYMTMPGYGVVWQPYLAGADWNPFMNGGWAWYPGIGYSWVSAYPWGWMPYYYGSWAYMDSVGWFWSPGGIGQDWSPAPVVVNAPPTFKMPRPPSKPPVIGGGRTMFVVNRRPMPVMRSPNKVVLRSGSAGLGVPRGSIHNWNKITAQVQRNGVVTTKIHSNPMPAMFAPATANSPVSAASRGAMPRGAATHGTNAHSFPSSAASRGPSMSGGAASANRGSMGGSPARSPSMGAPPMHAPSMSGPPMSAPSAHAPSMPAPSRGSARH